MQPALSPADKNTLVFEVRKAGNDYSNIATMPLQAGMSPSILTDDSMHYPSPGDPPHNRYQFWANNPIWTADGQNIIYLSDFFKGGDSTTPKGANPTCTGISGGDFVIDMGIVETPANAKPLPAVDSNGQANPPRRVAWPYCSAGGDQDLSLRPGVADTEVLFTSFKYDGPQNNLIAQLSLLIIPNDGSPERIVQLSPPDPNTVSLEPSWSPDGKYITYIRRENGQDNLYIMPIPDAAITGTPNLLPDGEPEVYSLEQGDASAYYTNTSYYNHSQKLADGMYGNPVWSPDGKHLVFMKFDTTDNGGTFNLFLVTLKFATPSASPTSTATPAPTTAAISIDGAQVQLTQGGIDGESRPIWTQ
jgi:Tol biopolymer transport system component